MWLFGFIFGGWCTILVFYFWFRIAVDRAAAAATFSQNHHSVFIDHGECCGGIFGWIFFLYIAGTRGVSKTLWSVCLLNRLRDSYLNWNAVHWWGMRVSAILFVLTPSCAIQLRLILRPYTQCIYLCAIACKSKLSDTQFYLSDNHYDIDQLLFSCKIQRNSFGRY